MEASHLQWLWERKQFEQTQDFKKVYRMAKKSKINQKCGIDVNAIANFFVNHIRMLHIPGPQELGYNPIRLFDRSPI